MKLAIRQPQQLDLVLSDEKAVPDLLGMSGKVVILSFRGTRIRVIAAENPEGQRACSAPEPVTDPLHLELLTGPGEAPDWRRPVSLQAVLEARSDPVLAVQQASRWASYSARVAVVPQARLDDRALLEARLRGVWLIAVSAPGQLQVAVVGEHGAAVGSARGLAHRMLDELIWQALHEQKNTSTMAVRSAATT
jgi:hypothetical protein